MNVDQKTVLLDMINQAFDRFVQNRYDPACGRGCAACCTHDIAATTLEAHRALKAARESGRSDLIERVAEIASGDLFRPRITTNTLAMACMTHQESPIEEPGDDPGPCAFLENDCCLVYDARPFNCRCMVSQAVCRSGGEAEMPPELASLATVVWQIVEHLDAGGLYGNLHDLIVFLNDPTRAFQYSSGQPVKGKGLPPTRPVPGLLTPPEHQAFVQGFLDDLFGQDCGGRTFRERVAEMRNSPF